MPCSENWDAMMPTACGRFCAVCQKEVIDVTEMDDDTILQKYTDNGGNLCIRAREEQLTPIIPVQTFPMQRLTVFALAVWLVFAGGLVSEIQAQIETLPTKKIEIPDEMLYSTLTVRVIDENNQPVDSAEVNIRGLNLKRITDKDGYATFEQVKKGEYLLIATTKKNLELAFLTLEAGCHNYTEMMFEPNIPTTVTVRELAPVRHVAGAPIVIETIESPSTSFFPSLSGVFDNNGNVILEQYKIR